MNLKTNLCGVNLSNPTILASGLLGTSAGIVDRVAKSGAGAVTIKSIGPIERVGNKNPRILEWDHGIINAVGLHSSGYKNYDWEGYDKLKVPLITSIYGSTVEEYAEVAEDVWKHGQILEMNISCPNKHDGMSFCMNLDAAKEVVKAVKKKVKVPVAVKLTPNVPNIGLLAKEVEKAGADIITAINTVGPGMVIDIDARTPILSFKTGGLSGPAIKPIAIKCVYDIYENVKIPIIGVGGITNGKDAIEMIMAGATAVSMGSAVYYRGMDVFSKVSKEIGAWLKKNNTTLNSIRGAAHD